MVNADCIPVHGDNAARPLEGAPCPEALPRRPEAQIVHDVLTDALAASCTLPVQAPTAGHVHPALEKFWGMGFRISIHSELHCNVRWVQVLLVLGSGPWCQSGQAQVSGAPILQADRLGKPRKWARKSVAPRIHARKVSIAR